MALLVQIDDCRVVAETEAAGLQVLLSVDRDLRMHLQPHTGVRILRPTDFWRSLGITQEPDTTIGPAAGNPLRGKTWWKFPEKDVACRG